MSLNKVVDQDLETEEDILSRQLVYPQITLKTLIKKV